MRTIFLVLASVIFCLVVPGQGLKNDLKAELAAMRDRDQSARRKCASGGLEEQTKCLAAVFETVDKPNTKRLNEIFDSRGFPGVEQVGKDGVKAFFLLLQHSGDLELKKKCAPGIERAFREGSLNPSEYAGFIDRLLVDQGKPQVYGSNFESKDGKIVMSPAEAVEELDTRRKAIGLPPISEYVKMLKEFYKLEVVLN